MIQDTPDFAEFARLVEMVQRGYYNDIGDREPTDTVIPWVGKTCNDCPFFRQSLNGSNYGTCGVRNESVAVDAETCAYFDPGNRDLANEAIRNQTVMTTPQWRAWFEDNRIPLG